MLFEMDQKGLNHIQMKKQFDKAKVLSLFCAITAAAANNISAAGAGILAGSRQSLYTKFSSVTNIRSYRRQNCIKVSSLFVKNQVYVQEHQFDFVWQFLMAHCPNAKLN